MLLAGKTALVCGVANDRSIAWGVARTLKQHGAEVAVTCVEGARRRVQKLTAEFGIRHVITCDVTSDEDIARAFGEVSAAFSGKLDILVHSIAYARLEDLGGEFLQVDREGWRIALDISAYSLVALAKQARPLLVSAGGGSIMTLSFIGGEQVVPSYNVMGVAKAALECTVRYLAYDLGPDRIRVNAISSGPIFTASSMVVDRFQEALEGQCRTSPLLSEVTPDDIGNAAAFLASDLSKTVTATTMYVDAGSHSLSPMARDHPRVTAR